MHKPQTSSEQRLATDTCQSSSTSRLAMLRRTSRAGGSSLRRGIASSPATGSLARLMAFRASSSRLNMQRQHSGNVRDVLEDSSQLAALPVQRRRPLQGRLKRAGSSGKFEKKGHYEACGTVKLLIAAAQTADVTHLEQAYSAEGYDVVLAQDAQGVLEAVKAFPHPDLVLMTYTLPGLTGSQVVRAIRRIHPDLPIFALSTSRENTASSIKQDLYGGALQDWLKLPVDDGEAVARTEGALRHQYQVVKKLRNEMLVLRGEIDALQRTQQENNLPAKLETQQSCEI